VRVKGPLMAHDDPPRHDRVGRARRAAPPGSAAARPRRARSQRARRRALFVLLAAAAVLAGALVLALSHSGRSKSTAAAAQRIVKVVIPEGKTRAQIALIARADGLSGSYLDAARSSSLLDARSYGAPAGTHGLEGFLFPATYDMYTGEPAGRLVDEQLAAFREDVPSSALERARALHITPYDLLIVASMVEREAVLPGDRSKIAAVIYNRLREGMPLGIDASIYYAVEQARGIATYSGELTEEDLHIDSPYNTRTHVGLPPTPIANPGLASILAAAHPAHVPYLYYVSGADGCGEQVFSATAAEFEANVAAYDAAVARSGGHPPACKHH